MNNKGQSLVLFVLLMPIILGLIVLVIDVGKSLVEKNSINNKIELVMEYGLEDNLSIEEINDLLKYNLKTNNYSVTTQDEVINIKVKTYTPGIISNIVNFKGFTIESEYRGFIQNDKKIIEKVKW